MVDKTLQSIGALTNPCRTPALIVKKRPTSPSTHMTASVLVCRSSRNLITCGCTPYNLSTCHGASRLMLSQALVKATDAIARFGVTSSVGSWWRASASPRDCSGNVASAVPLP
eukprot:365257-Chlamydomonas_euryale.AAC.13